MLNHSTNTGNSNDFLKRLDELCRKYGASPDAKRNGGEAEQLSIVFEPTPREMTGTSVMFLRSSLFTVTAAEERAFVDNAPIAALGDLEFFYTGRELNQLDLTAYMAVCDLYREHTQNGVARFTLYHQSIRDICQQNLRASPGPDKKAVGVIKES